VALSGPAHEHAEREAADQDPAKNHKHSNIHRISLGRKSRKEGGTDGRMCRVGRERHGMGW